MHFSRNVLDADYLALPEVLQQMVLKVYTANWTEDNCDSIKPDWDSDYAKKYRVQLYEPYNEPEAAAKALGTDTYVLQDVPLLSCPWSQSQVLSCAFRDAPSRPHGYPV